MREFPEFPEVQSQALQELYEITKEDKMARLAVEFTNGAIRQVVADLCDHNDDVDCVLWAARCLRSCCIQNINNVNKACNIKTYDVGNALVTCMAQHTSLATVQEACLGAVVVLTAESNQAREIIASEGGIRAVIQSVETYRLDLGVQEMGIKALNNLCQGIPANVREAVMGGASTAIVGLDLSLLHIPHLLFHCHHIVFTH